MTYYNEGTFVTKTMEDMSKLVEILNHEELDPYGFDSDDAYESNGQFCLELNDCNGDIEQQIDKIAEACQKKHLDVDFEIITVMRKVLICSITECMSVLVKKNTTPIRWMKKFC